jgi:hypothetical protein
MEYIAEAKGNKVKLYGLVFINKRSSSLERERE